MKFILHPKDTYKIWQWIIASKAGQRWVHLSFDLKQDPNDPDHSIKFMNCRKYLGKVAEVPWMKQDSLGLFMVDLPVKWTPWIWDHVLTNRANSCRGSVFEVEVNEETGQVVNIEDLSVTPEPESDIEEDYIPLHSEPKDVLA